ncbi:MAG: hypothetical protein ACREP5_07965 [Candidatus Binatia bacterium]
MSRNLSRSEVGCDRFPTLLSIGQRADGEVIELFKKLVGAGPLPGR